MDKNNKFTTPNLSRDESIDILRFIALTGLIIIYIDPYSLWVREIRNFDVPMMVFLSGVSYSMSTGKKLSYEDYVKKRIWRLIVPTWIFLVLYYVFVTICNLVFYQKFELNPLVIFSFTLLTTWYVWVIRVFFIIALLAPLVANLSSKRKTF